MKSVLITGANRSTGLETAKQLSKQRLFIYLGSCDLEKGKAVVKKLAENEFDNIKAIQIDVTNPDTILAAKNIVENEQGKLDTILLAYKLKDLPFEVNAIDPGYTATDFNHHCGPGTVESAAAFIIKHTLTEDNAPSGKFFSNDIEDGTEVSP